MAVCHALPSCSLAHCAVPTSSVHIRSSVGTSFLCSWQASWQVPLAEPWQPYPDGSQFHQCTPLAADDGTSRHDPLADSWTERPYCGNPTCVFTTVERNSTVNDSSASKPAERSPPAGCIPDPWPLRTDFHWVPGSNLEPSMALHDY